MAGIYVSKGKADESNKVIWDICPVCKIRKKNEVMKDVNIAKTK